MPAQPDKPAIFAAYRVHLERRIGDLGRVTAEARSGTRVDGTHRPANRGERGAVTSQGYLTHGLAQRQAEVQAHLDLLDTMDPRPRAQVVMGAVIHIEAEDGTERCYALLPGGDGTQLTVGDLAVTVLSPDAPIARSLAGLAAGDGATWRGSDLEITAIG